MKRSAVGCELLAELRIGSDMTTLTERGEASRMPDPRGESAVHSLINGGGHPGQQRGGPLHARRAGPVR